MRHCVIGGKVVDPEEVRVSSTTFGRSLSPEIALPYVVELGHEDVVSRFDHYYQDFVEREREDLVEDARGLYLQLRETGYLPLAKIIETHPALIANTLQKILPAEFLGFLFDARESSIGKKRYTLHTLSEVEVFPTALRCAGWAFDFEAVKSADRSQNQL